VDWDCLALPNRGARPRACLTLSLMSDFDLRFNGAKVQVPLSSQRLISLVALHDRPVRRSKVSGTLWLDSPEDRATANLRSALWRTPSPAGIDIVVADATHLQLNPLVEVDFRATIAHAQAILDATTPAIEAIDVARELCSFGDDLLPGWYDDWLSMEREKFHHLRLQALDEVGEALFAAGRLADALQVALASVQTEPLRETSHRLAVRVHVQQGNIAEAIKQYRGYARLLADELGAAPSQAMQSLITPCLGAHTAAADRVGAAPHSDTMVATR
jgi:DNA-binding SARP family transcriptional activator